jgi:hypothetical protein
MSDGRETRDRQVGGGSDRCHLPKVLRKSARHGRVRVAADSETTSGRRSFIAGHRVNLGQEVDSVGTKVAELRAAVDAVLSVQSC